MTRPSPDNRSIGPRIPLPSPALPSHHDDDDDDDDDDYVPALPPDMLAARTAAAPKPPPKKVIGPALPPSMAARAYQYDDDDDDYGPPPPPSGTVVQEKDGVQEFLEKEEKRRKQIEASPIPHEASKPKALQREEWMLKPPSSSDLLGSIDPTRLTRPRQFARTSAPARDSDNSLWTETPAERQQRLADEVAGKRRRVTDAAPDPEEEREARKRARHDAEVRRGVEEHTKKVRGGTLIERHAHASAKPKGDGDGGDGEEGPPAIWDHARDMALSGRLMDDKSREKAIRDARGLGERFGSGKSGGFL
ncbi:predicted protein [Postia placenta Mad-698-R]|nr:predicted protein [Postia placenta Mad-698-R]